MWMVVVLYGPQTSRVDKRWASQFGKMCLTNKWLTMNYDEFTVGHWAWRRISPALTGVAVRYVYCQTNLLYTIHSKFV